MPDHACSWASAARRPRSCRPNTCFRAVRFDPGDAAVAMAGGIDPTSALRLAQANGPSPQMLATAAIRELWEETGLALGRPGVAPLPDEWHGFGGGGVIPDASGLRFIFRAITPPGRSRRFDARFFLADASAVAGDLDDFSAASEELGHLHWLPLAETGHLDLPFITEIVLAEVTALVGCADPIPPVPFFDNSGPVPAFRRIG